LLQAHENDVRRLDHLFDLRAQQRTHVRQVRVDVAAIRAHEPRQVHFGIEDAQLAAFADQPLRHQDQRGFAQVVCAGLERQAEHADLRPAELQYLVDSVIDVDPVAHKQAREHRDLEIVLLGDGRQRAQILRQTGPAEREAGLQVSRRNVEPRVRADEAHHFVRVDP
jgi:hypothetical protein